MATDYQRTLDCYAACARAQGWRVEPLRGGHVRFLPPRGTGRIVVASATASDHRAVRNLRADLRRAGLAV